MANEYKDLWFTWCLTTRNGWSKKLDDAWVDLYGTGPFYIQTKSYTNFSWTKVIETLKHMPEESNFNIAHIKIKNKWEFVAMTKDDWFEIVWIMMSNWIINP